ncbi:MAG: 1-acyl-sn-glycerol-3-phosphate acyltransferase [bacterium]
MQNIVIEKPYKFVPPCQGDLWPKLLTLFLKGYLERSHGVRSVEVLGVEHLKKSLDAGHGIMITPNHSRPCDPMVLAHLWKAVGRSFYIMASAHLFMQSRLQAFLLRRAGAFSVYREGMDREALKCAVQIIVDARKPLVLFPEGVVSRTNDRLNHLMDGTVFIARNAAKQRAGMSSAGKVVIHPAAIRYFFEGDIGQALIPVLETIERRFSWKPQGHKPLVDRVYKVGDALLTLKEIEYFEKPQTGELKQRLTALIDHLLVPLEQEWLKGKREKDVVARVKNLRTAILPEMVAGEIAEDERSRRWRQLADVYLAQQLFFYPPEYFKPEATPEKLMETVERFEEDLTDQVTIHRPIRTVIQIGEAIEVSPVRERGVETDPVMTKIRADLEKMMAELGEKRRVPNVSGCVGS